LLADEALWLASHTTVTADAKMLNILVTLHVLCVPGRIPQEPMLCAGLCQGSTGPSGHLLRHGCE